jgi:hypothetical protein
MLNLGNEGMATKSMEDSGFEPGEVVEHATRRPECGRTPVSFNSEVNPSEVVVELCVLLEEYAPTWYEEGLRHRVLTALRLPTDVLVELCALLEDHAPTWYTEKQRMRALGVIQALGLLEQDTHEESK